MWCTHSPLQTTEWNVDLWLGMAPPSRYPMNKWPRYQTRYRYCMGSAPSLIFNWHNWIRDETNQSVIYIPCVFSAPTTCTGRCMPWRRSIPTCGWRPGAWPPSGAEPACWPCISAVWLTCWPWGTGAGISSSTSAPPIIPSGDKDWSHCEGGVGSGGNSICAVRGFCG